MRRARRGREAGWGKFSATGPTYIAGLAILLSFAGLIAIAFCPVPDKKVRNRLILLFSGVITTGLGYLFGSRRSD
jgi:hypothetical protein